MPTSSYGPKLLKGALVTVASGSTIGSLIVFQYNPATLNRSFRPQYLGSAYGDQAEGVRFQGAPVETIGLRVIIDATDQLEAGAASAQTYGVHPQLAALELLVSPSVAEMKTELQKLASGVIEIVPPLAPLTVLIFGAYRVVPVRVDQVSIAEETHDPALNPIRANVNLTLRVLTYSDVDRTEPAWQMFFNYQTGKERLARQALGQSLASVVAGDPDDSLGTLESL